MSNQLVKTSNTPTTINVEREMTIADYMPLFYLIGTPLLLGGVYLVVVNPLLKRFGLKDSAQDKELDKVNDLVEAQAFWSPSWYKINGGNTISKSYANAYAKQLYCAMFSGYWKGCGNGFLGIGGGWGTDESAIGSVFNALGTKGNISLVSERYSQVYDSDLFTDLKSELDEGTEFADYVSKKISQYPS